MVGKKSRPYFRARSSISSCAARISGGKTRAAICVIVHSSSRPQPRRGGSLPCPQELLDRIVDRFLAVDLRQDQVLELVDHFPQLADVVARAVGAFHLAVAEQVAAGEQIGSERLQAALVVFAPVVAVRELKAINVPVSGREIASDDLPGDLVGRRDSCSAAFARAVEG